MYLQGIIEGPRRSPNGQEGTMEVECYKLRKHNLIVVRFHQNCICLVLNKQLFVVPRYYFLSVKTAAAIAIPMSASAINSAPVASLR